MAHLGAGLERIADKFAAGARLSGVAGFGEHVARRRGRHTRAIEVCTLPLQKIPPSDNIYIYR